MDKQPRVTQFVRLSSTLGKNARESRSNGTISTQIDLQIAISEGTIQATAVAPHGKLSPNSSTLVQ